MFFNIDWRGLLKAILKAALPFLLGGAIGVTASGCSSLQTPRAKTQTSAIYAFGLPAIVVTHDATQTADYSGGDTNETMQSNKQGDIRLTFVRRIVFLSFSIASDIHLKTRLKPLHPQLNNDHSQPSRQPNATRFSHSTRFKKSPPILWNLCGYFF